MATLRRSVALSAIVVALVAVIAYARFQLFPASRFDPQELSDYYAALEPWPGKPVDAARVAAAAQDAAAYIRRASDASGRFVYAVNLDPAVAVARDYSILRHQGTVYALGMYDDVYPDPANVEVMRRAVGFMRDCCYVPLQGGAGTGINEPDLVAEPGQRKKLKLGGAGLGLLALASLERKSPGSVPRAEMAAVARFGESLLRRDGASYSLYSLSRQRPYALEESLYYPGEMANGWVAYQQLYPDATHEFELAVKILSHLARTRARSGSAPADHWALLATGRLLEVANQTGRDVPRDALVNHALQICHAMLEEARHPQPLAAMQGALAARGAVTPTATRLEGMLAALRYLPPGHPIVPHVRAASDRGIDFLLRAQVRDGQYAGGFPQAIARLPDDGTAATQQFNRQATEIRIDYVQHSLSALVQYLNRAR